MNPTAIQMERRHQEDLQRLRGLRLLDDDFLTKVFDGDTEGIQLVLRIVMDKPDLKVETSQTQVHIENIAGRSVRLDIVATDDDGRLYNVEVQRADKGAGQRRARYNSDMLDVKFLEKNQDFDLLPEAYVIFITEHDVLGRGRPVYEIQRRFSDNGEAFGDGTHILYVNGAYRGDDAVGRLMFDFSCTDADDMHYADLAKRVRHFKEEAEGVAIMCKVMEDMRNESKAEGRIEGIAEGRAVGIAEGRVEGRAEMLNDLLAAGLLKPEDAAKFAADRPETAKS